METPAPVTSSEERAWWVVDASGQVLGRLAAQVAHVLRGKHKPTWAPHHDVGDFVVVVNASKVRLTGNKLNAKVWQRHSGYPGGIRRKTYGVLLATKPEEVVRRAVKGMLPKGPLGSQMLRKLKVYAGPNHPHGAQQPAALDLSDARYEPA